MGQLIADQVKQQLSHRVISVAFLLEGLRLMMIKCGPRYIRVLRIQHDSNSDSPRSGDEWWHLVGTLVTWDVYGYGGGIRALCDSNTDAARVGLAGQAGWLIPWPHMTYRQWYEQLPIRQICAILPVYAYVFGNRIRVDVEPFETHRPGQVGWIYCTNKSAERVWSLPHNVGAAAERKAAAIKAMTAEIKQLDCYLRGDVYGWVISDIPNMPGMRSGHGVASSWGHYGSNPYTNGMFDTIPEQHKYLLERECRDCGISRP